MARPTPFGNRRFLTAFPEPFPGDPASRERDICDEKPLANASQNE